MNQFEGLPRAAQLRQIHTLLNLVLGKARDTALYKATMQKHVQLARTIQSEPNQICACTHPSIHEMHRMYTEILLRELSYVLEVSIAL